MRNLNKIAFTIVKVLLSALFLMNVAAVLIILIRKWASDFDLESSMLSTPTFAVVILQNIALATLIFSGIVVSILCYLSRKKWVSIVGVILSLVASGFAGFYAIIFARFGLAIIPACYTVLSISTALLAYFSMRKLSSETTVSDNDPNCALTKPIWLTFAVILVIAGIWLTDEPLDQNFTRFYIDNHRTILDKDNVAVGLSGLDAPVGANFMDVGLEEFKSAQRKLNPTQSKVPAISESNSKIVFVGSSEELNCWVWIPELEKTSPSCASEERLKSILRANAELLERYWQVSRMSHSQGINLKGTIFLNLNRLIAADVELKLRHGHFEDAYQEWRENNRFVSRMIGEDTAWGDKEVFLVADSFSLASAEALIHTYKGVASVHGDELLNMLKPSGLARWNLPGVMRAEYDMLYPLGEFYDTQFWFHKNYIRNRMLHSGQAFLLAADSPPSLAAGKMLTVMHEHGGLKSWSNDYLKDPMNTILVRGLILGTQPVSVVDLIRPMYIHDGQQRALTLALLIKRRSLKDNEIANFLASVATELRNPFTGDPMGWDTKKRLIRFVVPHPSYGGGDVNVDVRL
jgi:hypothetical protein